MLAYHVETECLPQYNTIYNYHSVADFCPYSLQQSLLCSANCLFIIITLIIVLFLGHCVADCLLAYQKYIVYEPTWHLIASL